MNRPSPTVEFTTEGRLFANLNGSHGHYRAYQGLMDEWLSRAILAARKAGAQPVRLPVMITALVHRKDNRHSDAHNVTPTIKACIDAAVKVGIIPDDHDGIVRRLVTMRGENRPVPSVTIRVEHWIGDAELLDDVTRACEHAARHAVSGRAS